MAQQQALNKEFLQEIGLTEADIDFLEKDQNFKENLKAFINEHPAKNQYADEHVDSRREYLDLYTGPKDIIKQINEISSFFEIDGTKAIEHAKKLNKMPKGAEGWFAFPKLSAVVKKHFSTITDPYSQYGSAVHMVLKRAKYESCPSMENLVLLRTIKRTQDFINRIEEQQAGDIVIIAAQYGMGHRGESTRRTRVLLKENEFCLNFFMGACMFLTHPERYEKKYNTLYETYTEPLEAEFCGDEFAAEGKNIPLFGYHEWTGLEFCIRAVNKADPKVGSVTGFIS